MAADNTHKTPRVFISSTVLDLAEHRLAAVRAATKAGFLAQLSEDWEASSRPPLKNCLEHVDQCHLAVVLVAGWHGWTPADATNTAFKSITRLECERAVAKEYDIIPFLLNLDSEDWPCEHRESYRAVTAIDDDLTDDNFKALRDEIKRNNAALIDFRSWLEQDYTRNTFTTPADLEEKLGRALRGWLEDHPEHRPSRKSSEFNREEYLDWLRRQCESVELLGNDQKEAHNVRLQHMYVPARIEWIRDKDKDRASAWALLTQRLAAESLYVPGAPGAGKSTFCRWLALITAIGEVPSHPIAMQGEYVEAPPGELQNHTPVLCYLRDFNDHKPLLRGSGRWTRKAFEKSFAAWFDATQPGGLTGSSWSALLERGQCLMILDGVDEIQSLYKDGNESHLPRSNFLSGLVDALPYWLAKNNRVLLTSRPYGLSAADRQKLGLATADLLPLDEPLQHTFIHRWFAAVDAAHAEEKSNGLIEHLAVRDDLRELRESPMLLTALCVKYDEGRRLPRDMHILYNSIINQVLHGRYQATIDQQAVRRRLAAVALGMHTGDAVGQARTSPEAAVNYRELERILTAYAGQEPASESGASSAAEKREELISQSGLLLPRSEEHAGFFHLSIQEYLAAERLEVLCTDLADYLQLRADVSEWRRTLMFLFCVIAESRPQVALDAIHKVLLPQLGICALRRDPNPAWLLLDCLEIAHTRRWTITDFTQVLWQNCEESLVSDLSPELRNTLWLAAGKLGVDQRPGVGLRVDGLPDIVWCAIAPGRVALEDDTGQFDVAAFSIAKYPVTNLQFQAFVDAEDGYRNTVWWASEWLARGWENLDSPPSSRWIEPNAPRETVSLHQAVAFCRWLDHHYRARCVLDTGQQVRLLTEWEWQLAASGGERNLEFPWPGPWDPAKLNSGESGPMRTTAVGLYPAGAVPCGALDMAGNSWEWCLNKYKDSHDTALGGEDPRVVRGGSWVHSRVYCRSAYRHWYDPHSRDGNIGFRLCLSSPIVDD